MSWQIEMFTPVIFYEPVLKILLTRTLGWGGGRHVKSPEFLVRLQKYCLCTVSLFSFLFFFSSFPFLLDKEIRTSIIFHRISLIFIPKT